MRLRGIVYAVVCLTLAALLPGRSAAADQPPPVILVLVDTLRADYLGCYGFEGEISPNLDRLCRESVVFRNCYSQAPWTKPAIATLFTSLDPASHQVLTHKGQYSMPDAVMGREGDVDTDVLPGWTETLAEVFERAGYVTAGFVANPWIRGSVGFGQGFQTFDDRFAANATSAEVIIEEAIRWLDQRPRDKPFFLYLHFMDVHDPYVAPESDYEALRDAPGLGADRKLRERHLSKGLLRGLKRVGGGAWARDDQPDRLRLRTWRARYAAGVRAFDRRFQALLDYLARHELDRESLLAITSDHGEELFEHGGWAHGLNLYEHQLRVPLIVRRPKGAGAGTAVDRLVGLIDVAPTLLGWSGLEIPKAMRGRNVARGDGGNAAVYAGAVKWQPETMSVRTERFKLIREAKDKREQLFDLSKDPGEKRDVAKANPKTLAHLRRLLDAHARASAATPRAKPERVPVDKATQERLRALGY